MNGRATPPPSAETLGFRLLEIDPELGTIRVEFDARPEFVNPMGAIQGGFLAAMLDDTLGPALVATLPDGSFAPTLELKVSFVRPAGVGKLIGVGRVVSRGGTIAFLAGELLTEGGDLVATASATARIVQGDNRHELGAHPWLRYPSRCSVLAAARNGSHAHDEGGGKMTGPRTRLMRLVAAAAAVLAAGLLPMGASGAGSAAPAVEALSTLPQYVSGGDVLVEIRLHDDAASLKHLRIEANGRDVSASFRAMPDGSLHGLVDGLALGENEIVARANGQGKGTPPGRSATLRVVNHPLAGRCSRARSRSPSSARPCRTGSGPRSTPTASRRRRCATSTGRPPAPSPRSPTRP